MKKLFIVSALLIFAVVGCQKKEEPKTASQFPAGPEMSAQTTAQETLLKEALAKDPNNLNAWISLGNMMMDSLRFSEAVDAYQKALDIDPKNPDVRVDMGTCYRKLGKPEVAVKEYRKALEFDPQHLQAYKNMGVVMAYDLHDSTQAISAFEKAVALAPNAPDADRLRLEIQKLKAAK